MTCFNTQPPEGGCIKPIFNHLLLISFNTQPPEGGCNKESKMEFNSYQVSTHSHPKVAARALNPFSSSIWFQHTATRRWLPPVFFCHKRYVKFQHTATRRWLPNPLLVRFQRFLVSTHSHPKVAAAQNVKGSFDMLVSTHSHPKVAASAD